MIQEQEDNEDSKDNLPEQTRKAVDNRFKNQKQKEICNFLSKEEEKILAHQNELKSIKRSTSKKGDITNQKVANISTRVAKKKTTVREVEANPKWFY